jgi:hypothetical protein
MAEQTTLDKLADVQRRLLNQPEYFVFLVHELERQELPREALIWMLKLWGAWHGFYPIERLPPPGLQEMQQLSARLRQLRSAAP